MKRILAVIVAVILLAGVAGVDVLAAQAHTPQTEDTGKAGQGRQETITVSRDAIKKVELGARYQIVVPNKVITACRSSAKKIAGVSRTGLITPKKAGEASITVQTKKRTITLTLKVVDPTVPTRVTIRQGKRGTIRVGQTLRLTAKVFPATASQSVRWKSDKKSIAKVSAKGKVTGIRPGKARITATAGKKQATFTVTVKRADTAPTPTPTPVPTLAPEPTPTPAPEPTEQIGPGTVRLTIGGRLFSATVADNATGRAFARLLPMTLGMSELNGNEKYCYLDESLPSEPERVGRIEAGDLMLYGDSCIVLFYESFSTQYSYTRIGRIDDIDGLASAVGSGGIQARFE